MRATRPSPYFCTSKPSPPPLESCEARWPKAQRQHGREDAESYQLISCMLQHKFKANDIPLEELGAQCAVWQAWPLVGLGDIQWPAHRHSAGELKVPQHSHKTCKAVKPTLFFCVRAISNSISLILQAHKDIGREKLRIQGQSDSGIGLRGGPELILVSMA